MLLRPKRLLPAIRSPNKTLRDLSTGAILITSTARATPISDSSQGERSLYMGPLDGLRALAFLLVLFHHLPQQATNVTLSYYGWVGVELFFVVSSFLFFHLLKAEHEKTGTINVPNFYRRRVLRIYPLLLVYYTALFVSSGGWSSLVGWTRYAAILSSTDNLFAWAWSYNVTVPHVAHLWTLSFESSGILASSLGISGLAALGHDSVSARTGSH